MLARVGVLRTDQKIRESGSEARRATRSLQTKQTGRHGTKITQGAAGHALLFYLCF